MIGDDVLERGVEGIKHVRVGRNHGSLHSVASGEVLRGDDGDLVACVGLDEDHLGVIVRKVGMLNDLGEEGPKFERFLGCLEIENQVDCIDASTLLDEVETTEELLGYGEGGLPNRRFADLLQYPLKHVSHLQHIREIALRWVAGQWLEQIVYANTSFHAFLVDLEVVDLVLALRVAFFFVSAGIAAGIPSSAEAVPPVPSGGHSAPDAQKWS